MADYTLTDGSSVVRNDDGAWIPADPHNADWQKYQAWLASGYTPLPYQPPPAAPEAWPPYTIILALEKTGVANVILSNTDELTKAKFYAARLIPETDPLLLAALTAVGKTIDDLKANITL
jgi:hypothetical protein